MINLTKDQIDQALTRVEDGLKKYSILQNNLHNIDVSKSRDFQRRFNHFYRVRRNSDWQFEFYRLLEDKKHSGTTFSEALRYIHEHTGQYEASFASKLVATIHPDKPVVDKFVLENTDLKLPYASTKNREAKIISVYNQLQERFTEFLNTESGKYLVKKFREKFSDADITEMKMTDLVLWQSR